MRSFFASLCLLLAIGCGARTPIDPGGSRDTADGSRPDGSVPGDGEVPRPDGMVFPDGGRPDGGVVPGACAISMPFTIVEQPGFLSWPALARLGTEGVLTFTAHPPEGPMADPRILAVPITDRGEPRGEPREVLRAEGGTIATFEGFGAHILLANFFSSLQAAVIDNDGNLLDAPGEPFPAMTDSFRPALAISLSGSTYALGWNGGFGGSESSLLIGRMEMEPAFVALDGRDPWAIRSRTIMEVFRISTVVGGQVLVQQIDTFGMTISREFVSLDRPVSIARVVESLDDRALVVLGAGGPTPSFSLGVQHHSAVSFGEFGWTNGLDVFGAWDEAEDRVYAAGIGQIFAPDGTVQHEIGVVATDGRTFGEVRLPIGSSFASQIAAMWTGNPGEVLVAWSTQGLDGFNGRIDAMIVQCR